MLPSAVRSVVGREGVRKVKISETFSQMRFFDAWRQNESDYPRQKRVRRMERVRDRRGSDGV